MKAFTIKYPAAVRQLKSEMDVFANGKQIKAIALWDTGATATCISTDVAQRLDMQPVGKRMISTPSGLGLRDEYLLDLVLPNNVMIKNVRVCDSEIGEQGIGVLVGMDIISLGDLAISNALGKTIFTFRIPPQDPIDYVMQAKMQASEK